MAKATKKTTPKIEKVLHYCIRCGIVREWILSPNDESKVQCPWCSSEIAVPPVETGQPPEPES